MPDTVAGAESTAAERWLAIHDEVLRGIAHALSNRIATMSVVSFMLEVDGADVARQADALRVETEQVEALLMAMRALPRVTDAIAEPMIAGDAVRAALALHAHHGELRDVACTIVGEPDAVPVLADPLALQHAVLVALTSARRHAAARGVSAIVELSTQGDAVAILATAEGSPGSEIDELTAADARAAEWLLAPHGGHATPRPAGCLLQVPTLQAARQSGLR